MHSFRKLDNHSQISIDQNNDHLVNQLNRSNSDIFTTPMSNSDKKSESQGSPLFIEYQDAANKKILPQLDRQNIKQEKYKFQSKKRRSNYEFFQENSNNIQNRQQFDSQSSLFENKIFGSKAHSIEEIRILINLKQKESSILSPFEAHNIYRSLKKTLQVSPQKFSILLDPNFNKEKLWAENYIDRYQQIKDHVNQATLRDFQKEMQSNKEYALDSKEQIGILAQSQYAITLNKLNKQNIQITQKKSQWGRSAEFKNNILDSKQLLIGHEALKDQFFTSPDYFSRVRDEHRYRKKPFSSIPYQMRESQTSFNRHLKIEQSRRKLYNFNNQNKSLKRSESSSSINLIIDKNSISRVPVIRNSQMMNASINRRVENQYFPERLKSQTGIQTQIQRNSIFTRKYIKRRFQISSNVSQTIKSAPSLYQKNAGRRNKIFSASIVSKNLNYISKRQAEKSDKKEQVFNQYGIRKKIQIRNSKGLNNSQSSLSIEKTRRNIHESKHKQQEFEKQRKSYNKNQLQYHRRCNDYMPSRHAPISPVTDTILSQYLNNINVPQRDNKHTILTPVNHQKLNSFDFKSPTSVNAFELYSSTPQRTLTRSTKKLSTHILEKQSRKQTIPSANLNKMQIKYIDNFAKCFSCNQDFWRFRRNCFEENIGLYVSDSLYISGVFQLRGKSLSVSILYVNKSRQKMSIEVLYKIPKCFKIQKSNQVKKKFELQSKGQYGFSNTHIFSVFIKDLPIQPCLISLSCRDNQIITLNRQIVLPITIKNFCKPMMVTQSQWQAKYLESDIGQASIRRFCTIELDSRATMLQIGQLLHQFVDLPAIQHYSLLEKGAVYLVNIQDPLLRHNIENQLIFRFIFKTDRVLIIESLVHLKNTQTYDISNKIVEESLKNFIMLFSIVSGNKF